MFEWLKNYFVWNVIAVCVGAIAAIVVIVRDNIITNRARNDKKHK